MTAELRNLPHIASMAFNEPLMLEPAYARVFFCALAGQLGISRLTDAVSGDSLTAGEAPAALALSVDDDGPRQARSYQVMNGIAVLPVSGTLVSRTRALQPYSGMTGYNGIIARLQQATSDPMVDGILLDMDTPGGMVAGAFDCADIIARMRDIKPVWALANDMNCSAGQLLASAASRRLVTQTARTGSIGVMMAHSNYGAALEKQGVEITLIYSGSHKVDGNPYSHLPDDVRETLQSRMDATRRMFAQKVSAYTGLSVQAVLDMLPAQFTDVATQLAGGQSPWLILLQQGGQVKDSFGGMIPMFRGLAGAITLPMVGATSLAVATGALAYAWYQGNSTLSDFNKTLVLSGNQAGLTADRMLVLSRAGQAAGLTFNQTSESLSALVKAGVSGEAQIASISQSVARFSSASGVEVDKVAEAFGKLTTDPTSGLTAMARQFHNVTAEQIAYVAQLQRSGDEAGALQAANEAATKGFDDQTRRLKENMGTLETWADRTARAFKSMWDAVLDIGRPDTAQEMLIKAEAAFKKADDIWNLRKDDYFVNDEARARYWDDREKARLALEAARKKAEQQTQQDKNAQQQSDTEASRLKYTEEAQKAYERLQTPLEKYTARQEELNKALKDGKILQADYNTLMAAAKKDYEATLKKPKQSGVKVSAGDRQEDSAHAALLTLQAELRTLEKHAGANEKISQQRRDLWKAESQFAVLEEAAQRRQLSAQEKSLLAHKDETLEYKRQLAALGDKVTYQERLNALAQQADKFAQQQRAKRAAIDAKSRGLTDRQAEREATEQRLKEQYGDNPLALNNVMSEQKKTWAAEDQLRGSWMAGLKSGWSEWEESATDSMSQVKSAATQTFDGIAQNMAAMLTGSEQNWRSFTRSVLSMMTEILLKQAMVGIVGSIGSAIGGAASGGASASGGTAIQAAAAKFHFATGGFTGTGGKYEPAGIVHRGEFVFTKEATSRIGVGNLYRLMRGYAEGGYVGGAGSPAQMRRAEGINFNQNNHVVIQNDGTNGLPGPQMMKAVYDMARKGARDEIQTQMRDGGLFSGGGR